MKNTSIIIGAAAIAVVIGAFVFLYSPNYFSNAPSSGAPENRVAAVAVPFTELARGAQSTVRKRVNYIITSSDQFRDLWGLVGAKGRLPDIDFSKSAVAAVFAGEKPTEGYGIAVSKVEDASARKIIVTLTQPDSGCVLKKTTTTPYQIVEFPNTQLQFTHEDISTTSGCPK